MELAGQDLYCDMQCEYPDEMIACVMTARRGYELEDCFDGYEESLYGEVVGYCAAAQACSRRQADPR